MTNWTFPLANLELPPSDPNESPRDLFQNMVDAGLIDAEGRVLKQPDWDAYLAIVEVKRNPSGQIEHFRCLVPAFGLPGGATVDVSRKHLIDDIVKRKKKIITAWFDPRIKRWKQGSQVHVNSSEHVRTDSNDTPVDNIGELPEFSHVRNRA